MIGVRPGASSMTRDEAVHKLLKLTFEFVEADLYQTAAGLTFLAAALRRGEEYALADVMGEYSMQSDSAHEFFKLAEEYRLMEKPDDEASES